MIREAISTLVEGQSLSQQEASSTMNEIMTGETSPAQVAAFITALRMKGEAPEEIAGMAQVMREKSLKVSTTLPLVDTCGTGGDSIGTFNISTAAALVTAAAGVPVAKHGNRAASGVCGSADVLEALSVKIDLGPSGVKECLEQVGIGFMFAPIFHPSMKHAADPRREIGVRTVFNILGPLTNPAGAKTQVLGIADRSMGPKMIQVLDILGVERAMVVHGQDGTDELSLSGETHVWDLNNGVVHFYTVRPEDVGLQPHGLAGYQCRSPEEHVSLFREVLDGQEGPALDVVALNASAALLIAGKVGTLSDGVKLALSVARSGAALAKLNHLASLSKTLE